MPGRPGSAALETLDTPERPDDGLLVEALALGICGTDREIVDGRYGTAPDGRDRLILGHESLGRVLEAPAGSSARPGDLVVPFVRRPDPVPCVACAAGEWDMCRDGRYTEHGIKGRDGFGAQRYTVDADAVVVVPDGLGPLGVLVEPASVVAKAWEHTEAIGRRAVWAPERVLVTGAGPIGLLAALLATQRGYDVHVVDVVDDGPKPALVRALGATYHRDGVAEPCRTSDVVVECTGVPDVVFEVLASTPPACVVCLTGVSSTGRYMRVDAGALNRELVLENDVVFGSVNANARHYRAAVDALVAADRTWLEGIVTRTVPLGDWEVALAPDREGVKSVIAFGPDA